jgi:hypothetical protein
MHGKQCTDANEPPTEEEIAAQVGGASQQLRKRGFYLYEHKGYDNRMKVIASVQGAT